MHFLSTYFAVFNHIPRIIYLFFLGKSLWKYCRERIFSFRAVIKGEVVCARAVRIVRTTKINFFCFLKTFRYVFCNWIDEANVRYAPFLESVI